MTEDEARAYVLQVAGEEGHRQIALFLDLVIAENAQQNLIARSSVDHIWTRHAADSVQLLAHAANRYGLWIDVGTGGGFPGLVLGLLRKGPTLLVEPRRRRAEFLVEATRILGVHDRVTVAQSMIEKVAAKADIISARAVASVENLLSAARGCATRETRWVLPRGRVEQAELSDMLQRWSFMFHVEHSVTDDRSSILLLDEVSRR